MNQVMTKRIFRLILIGFVFCVLLYAGDVSRAEGSAFKDIKADPQKYLNQELTVSGKVGSSIYEMKNKWIHYDYRRTVPVTRERSAKINVYILNDQSADILMLTFKDIKFNSDMTFKARVLMTSDDQVSAEQAQVFHKNHIDDEIVEVFQNRINNNVDSDELKARGDFCERVLREINGRLHEFEPWVLLIDLE